MKNKDLKKDKKINDILKYVPEIDKDIINNRIICVELPEWNIIKLENKKRGDLFESI